MAFLGNLRILSTLSFLRLNWPQAPKLGRLWFPNLSFVWFIDLKIKVEFIDSHFPFL